MLQISHEVPLAMLESSFTFNDYDYCLPTFLHHKEYWDHFVEARKRNRFIIMDNGLFEGEIVDEKSLIHAYNTIKPDVFIVPDAWNDSETTWDNYTKWKDKVDPSKIMIVIQANTMFEAEDLYDALIEDGCKYIGFNHLGKFYDDYSCHSYFETRKTLGRVEFISYLKETNKLKSDVHHHLLGCNIAEEFKYYPSVFYPEIKTLDTSNPVTLAFENIDYETHRNILSKPKTKVENIFITEDQNKIDLALKNIKQFKQFIS
jgi:hypothetical protein